MSYHNVVEDEVGDMISDFTYDEFVIDRFYKSMLDHLFDEVCIEKMFKTVDISDTMAYTVLDRANDDLRIGVFMAVRDQMLEKMGYYRKEVIEEEED